MLLKLQKDKANVKVELKEDATYAQLLQQVQEKLRVSPQEADLLTGYPPHVVNARGDDLLVSLGIKSGSVVTVRENVKRRDLFNSLASMGFAESACYAVISSLDISTATPEDAINMAVELASGGGDPAGPRIQRKVINADNSCLFNAIGYLVLGEETYTSSFNPSMYRQVVADAIQRDSVTYTPEMLGKPVDEYVRWITQADKWGGEIELHALAKELGLEIAAVDIRTGNLLVYGEGEQLPEGNGTASQGAPKKGRIYVLYDGVHYDAVIRERSPQLGNPEVTVFDPTDASSQEEVLQLAKTLRENKQFVNLSSGSLQCKVCFAVLAGETAAVEHAKATGHQNFGQV